MAERGMSASVKTEIAKTANRPCYLVSLHFDSGTTYMTDYHRELTYDGNDYLAFGNLLGATDIEETSNKEDDDTTIDSLFYFTVYILSILLSCLVFYKPGQRGNCNE